MRRGKVGVWCFEQLRCESCFEDTRRFKDGEETMQTFCKRGAHHCRYGTTTSGNPRASEENVSTHYVLCLRTLYYTRSRTIAYFSSFEACIRKEGIYQASKLLRYYFKPLPSF